MPVKIKRMTATFGALDHASLTLDEGLTVITAPNEAGKSTWAGFMKAMLYGVDTKERDKVGYLADKNRFQPWSGAPMSGQMELEWQGKEVTLRRSSNRSGPFQQLEAVYTASGDPLPGVNAANAGEMLLGVGKDVFTRSALVGQNASVISSTPELERRIAALATTAQEDVSFSATQRTLKDWHNRRKSNRANGLIPELEQEIARMGEALADMENARQVQMSADVRLKQLEEERQELQEESDLHRKLAQKALNTRYSQALSQLEEAESQLSALPEPDPVFSGMTVQQAWDYAARCEASQKAAEEQAAQSAKKEHRRKTICLALGAAGALIVLLSLLLRVFFAAIPGAALILAAVIFVLRSKGAQPSSPPAEPIPDWNAYGEYLGQKERLEQQILHCRERADDLLAQGAEPVHTLELLPEPKHSAAETTRLLFENQNEAARWRSRMDRAAGALRTDPLELSVCKSDLEARLEQRKTELSAIDLALDALERANATLRQRFSPALNAETAAIFSKLTGGKYSALTLSRDLTAMVEGDGHPHSALYLSTGTVDQLYLAVRLALCNLTAPECPIVLDDALCAFDDRRMALALQYLKELSRTRQVILFSCQSREARWAAENGVTAINL